MSLKETLMTIFVCAILLFLVIITMKLQEKSYFLLEMGKIAYNVRIIYLIIGAILGFVVLIILWIKKS